MYDTWLISGIGLDLQEKESDWISTNNPLCWHTTCVRSVCLASDIKRSSILLRSQSARCMNSTISICDPVPNPITSPWWRRGTDRGLLRYHLRTVFESTTHTFSLECYGYLKSKEERFSRRSLHQGPSHYLGLNPVGSCDCKGDSILAWKSLNWLANHRVLDGKIREHSRSSPRNVPGLMEIYGDSSWSSLPVNLILGTLTYCKTSVLVTGFNSQIEKVKISSTESVMENFVWLHLTEKSGNAWLQRWE